MRNKEDSMGKLSGGQAASQAFAKSPSVSAPFGCLEFERPEKLRTPEKLGKEPR